MTGFVIRPVSARDYDGICLLEQGPSGCRYQAAVFVRQAMTLWPRSFLIAEADGTLAGYLVGVISSEDPSGAWIIRVRVAAEMQRQGIGTAMMERAHMVLQEMGALRVLLSCSPVNEGALSLYAKAGYLVIQREAAYFGPGEDRLILSKSLTEISDS